MDDHIQPLLDAGWKPHGSLSVRTYIATAIDVRFEVGDRITIYTQALIKEESPDEAGARINYFEILLAKPIDQLTPEERKERDDYLEVMRDDDSPDS